MSSFCFIHCFRKIAVDRYASCLKPRTQPRPIFLHGIHTLRAPAAIDGVAPDAGAMTRQNSSVSGPDLADPRHHITAENFGHIDFNEENGIVKFCPSWPPGPVATLDLKQPSPEPQQSMMHIQYFDQQQAQMRAQFQAQMALTKRSRVTSTGVGRTFSITTTRYHCADVDGFIASPQKTRPGPVFYAWGFNSFLCTAR